MGLGRRGQRTYWHLRDAGRRPNRYEIESSRLLYYPDLGFAVRSPVTEWYQRFQSGSRLLANDWEAFADPRQTTYATYVELQREQELVAGRFVEHALDRADDDAWWHVLSQCLSPLRYYFHAAMMCAAYVGSMAPSGRITLAASFQSADESRRVHCLAHRMGALRRQRENFGADGRQIFERDACWQPLRKVLEQLLATYDWGESFCTLDLVLKPMLESIVFDTFRQRALERGDHGLAYLLGNLAEDSAWHRAWALELIRVAVAQRSENSDFLEECLTRWLPRVSEATDALANLFGDGTESSSPADRARAAQTDVWRQIKGVRNDG